MNFTLAIAQIDSTVGNIMKNIERHRTMIHRAKQGGADVVVFPELSLTGYSLKDLTPDVALTPLHSQYLKPLLDESNGIAIILGCVEEGKNFGQYNAAWLLHNGTIQSVHKKVYPPTYGLFEEQRYFSSGRSLKAFETSFGRFGVLICEDLWHLPLPYVLVQDGAQIIFGLAASPTRVSPDSPSLEIAAINTEQHKAYARLLSSYMVFCNRVGFEDGLNFWGGSEVIAPSGEVIVQAKLFDEDLIFAEIDENEIRRARRSSRHFLDDDPTVILQELQRLTGIGT